MRQNAVVVDCGHDIGWSDGIYDLPQEVQINSAVRPEIQINTQIYVSSHVGSFDKVLTKGHKALAKSVIVF
jgi:hypothetical protein